MFNLVMSHLPVSYRGLVSVQRQSVLKWQKCSTCSCIAVDKTSVFFCIQPSGQQTYHYSQAKSLDTRISTRPTRNVVLTLQDRLGTQTLWLTVAVSLRIIFSFKGLIFSLKRPLKCFVRRLFDCFHVSKAVLIQTNRKLFTICEFATKCKRSMPAYVIMFNNEPQIEIHWLRQPLVTPI